MISKKSNRHIKKFIKKREHLFNEMKEIQSISNDIFNMVLKKTEQLSDESSFSSNLMELLKINHNYRIELIRLLEKLQ